MDSPNLEQRRDMAIRECDHPEEIDNAAVAAATSLMAGRAIEVAFAPGNGCRYVWLLVPISDTERYGHHVGLESSAVAPGGVWICQLIASGAGENVVYPLALLGRERDDPHPSYIAEKWFGGRPTSDVFILERLLGGIAELCRAHTLAPVPEV